MFFLVSVHINSREVGPRVEIVDGKIVLRESSLVSISYPFS